MGAGETVTCTFTNTKLGGITIVKIAENGNGIFPSLSQSLGDFPLTKTGSLSRGTAQGYFPDLAACVYDMQAPQPTGWVFVSQSCSGGSNPEAIDLGVGEDVTCTYVSKPEPTALDEIDEPEQFNRMFLPLIGR